MRDNAIAVEPNHRPMFRFSYFTNEGPRAESRGADRRPTDYATLRPSTDNGIRSYSLFGPISNYMINRHSMTDGCNGHIPALIDNHRWRPDGRARWCKTSSARQ